jgi:hypothetical protein
MTDNIYVPTDWVDGVTPVDEEHLDNTETQYRLVAGIQQMDALPAVPATGHNVCIVGNILYAWDGERWASMIRVVDTMPTPSAVLLGTVVLYVGTAGTYLPTYFYICTEAGGVYSWTPFSNNFIEWGEILGDIVDQTDLMEEFGKKVDILQAEALRILVTDASKNVSLEAKNTAFNKNYGTTTPIMNGTGAVGTADNIARTDHVHPIDTSRQSNITTTTGTLTVAGWSAKAQTISITGVTATTKSVRVSYAVASRDAYLASGVHCTAQGAGTLTFVCDTTPTAEITVNVELAE